MSTLKPSRPTAQHVAVYLVIAAITGAHYLTPPHAHQLHDIFRRLYYLPIILAAFLGGWKGGAVAALIVCLAYIPHAFGHISHDPATPTQKWLEMLLYFAVGLITGVLVSKLKGIQRQLERTTVDLRASLEQLRQAEDKLVQEARLAAVGRLSAGLAHEIRNPLSSIKGSAEILADDYPAGHPKRRLLQVLVEESVRLNRVLTRFLAFARPQPPRREMIDLRGEIEGVIALVQGREETGATAWRIAETPPDPGPTTEAPAGREEDAILDSRRPAGVSVFGDREQLRQVWLNLLLNGAQAAGPAGEVVVGFRRQGDIVTVWVRDSGKGFSAEALENVFTPFYTTKEQGTGLGLAVSHRIIEAHGGQVRVGNHLDGGGLVEVVLPDQTATKVQGAR